MKKSKNFLGLLMSLVLVLALCLTFAIPVFAEEESKEAEESETEAAEEVAEEEPAGEEKAEEPAEEKAEELPTVELESMSAEDFKAALEDENTLVIDTRTNDQFNGWAMGEGDLAGHIKGATDFSYRWLNSEYDEEGNLEGLTREEVLTEALEVKGITADKNIVLYDTNGEDAGKVAAYLQSKGIENVAYFNAKDFDGEVVRYANYSKILPPTVVKDYIDNGKAETLEEGKKYFIFNVSWGEVDQSGYLDGHVPTAIHVNTDWFEPEELGWMLDSDENLFKLMNKLGITKEDGAIVTGPEPMAATRFATILSYLGVSDVRYMNGALVNWKGYGFELETENNEPTANEDFGTDTPLNPELIINQDRMAEILEKEMDKFQLCDIRTREEFVGKSTGYSYHDKMGRLDQSIYGWAGINENSSSMYYYRNVDKTMRNGAEILAMMKGSGFDLAKPIITYCGSGWRAAEVVVYLQALGHEGDALYSDGWIGWSNNERPALNNDDAAAELPEKPVLDFEFDFDFEEVVEK